MGGVRSRLARLEAEARLPAGRCPHCPPPYAPIVEVEQHGRVLSGPYPPRCARCGGPHDGIRFIEVVLPRGEGDTSARGGT